VKRIALTAALSLLALPASAMAANKAVVLSVDAKHHSIQLVDTGHVVHAYQYRGLLPKLHVGSSVSFAKAGKTIKGIRVSSGASRSVSFYARVVRTSSNNVLLRLADGNTVRVSSKQLKHKQGKRHHSVVPAMRANASLGNITLNIQGLTPGVTVIVTESVDAQGNMTITITLPAPGSSVSTSQQASGTVTDVQTDTFVLTTSDGSTLNLHMAASALANLNLNVCDDAQVSYHQDANLLIADTAQVTGTSTSGDCASSGNPQDAVGAITAIAPDSVTVNVPGQGSMTFQTDPSAGLTDGFVIGDVVDVTYEDSGAGTFIADDVQYVQNDATGTVSSVSDGSITIIDDNTGQPVTFTADPSQSMFAGFGVGDQVDVSYHVNSGNNVVDQVSDNSSNSSDNGNNNGN
jgi:hypothetical protein